MSTSLVREKLRAFLKSDKAEVLCVRGNWGTGKTYTWDDVLKLAAAEVGGLSSAKYAYVSLFGMNSVEEVRREIVNQTIVRERIGQDFNPDDVGSIYNDGIAAFKKHAGILGKVFGENYYGAAMSVASLLVRDRLICIDDLERKGEGLRSTDVLGLISQLKEERKCKVVLLMNDEELEDRDEFEGYLEKVVDINLRFAPTPAESAAIALKTVTASEPIKQMVLERTTKLGIDNVRVIRKLCSFVAQIEPLLKGYEPAVFGSVASTIVLLGWCHLQPKLTPSMDFMVQRKGIFSDHLANKEGELTAKEQQWVKMLQDYGYTHTDDFDVMLLKGMQDGYFEKAKIDLHASELNLRVETDEAAGKLRAAWRHLFDAFDGEIDDALGPLRETASANVEFYSLYDVLSVVNVFRELDRKAQGDEVFEAYVVAKSDKIGAFDASDIGMYGLAVEEDLKQRLSDLQAAQAPRHGSDELFMLLEQRGYDAAITERLAEVPEEEYLSVLRRFKGKGFLAVRRGLTQYNTLSNPNDAQQQIMRKGSHALEVLAAESPLNAYRVQGWGLLQRVARLDAIAAQ